MFSDSNFCAMIRGQSDLFTICHFQENRSPWTNFHLPSDDGLKSDIAAVDVGFFGLKDAVYKESL